MKTLKPGAHVSENAKHFGLSTAGADLRLMPDKVTYTKNLSVKPREKIAAAHALGFTYWSDAAEKAGIWAADFDGRFHLLTIDARRGNVEHSCERHRSGYPGIIKCFEPRHTTAISAGTGTLEAVMLLLGGEDVPDPAPIPAPVVVAQPHPPVSPPASVTPDPAVELTAVAVEVVEQAARTLLSRTVERAMVMVNSNPATIATLHTAYLKAALGHTDHDQAIRDELDRRQQGEAAS